MVGSPHVHGEQHKVEALQSGPQNMGHVLSAAQFHDSCGRPSPPQPLQALRAASGLRGLIVHPLSHANVTGALPCRECPAAGSARCVQVVLCGIGAALLGRVPLHHVPEHHVSAPLVGRAQAKSCSRQAAGRGRVHTWWSSLHGLIMTLLKHFEQ